MQFIVIFSTGIALFEILLQNLTRETTSKSNKGAFDENYMSDGGAVAGGRTRGTANVEEFTEGNQRAGILCLAPERASR